jgi:hypothetical protein
MTSRRKLREVDGWGGGGSVKKEEESKERQGNNEQLRQPSVHNNQKEYGGDNDRQYTTIKQNTVEVGGRQRQWWQRWWQRWQCQKLRGLDGKWANKEEERTTIEGWRRRWGDGGCWWRRWWLWSATMMETNDNPPNNVRVALTSTVGKQLLAASVTRWCHPRLHLEYGINKPVDLPFNSYVASVCLCLQIFISAIS